MDVSLGGVEFLVGKIEMGEDKNQNWTSPSLHDFRVNLQQNNPLKLVVLRTVMVIIANWLAGVNKLLHHCRDGTNAGMDLQQIWLNSVKERQREDGKMRSMPWHIYLCGST